MESDISELGNLDRLIHEPARLMIMAVLYVVEKADFAFVMAQTNLTWGNISSHVSKLEEAGYVSVEKTLKGKRLYSSLRLSEAGRTAFQAYRQQISDVLGGLPD